MAYKFHFLEIERYTADIDLTVALDLDDFAELEIRLSKFGWNRDAKREHRSTSPRATLIDLLPAGAKLRAAKKLNWPESQLSMSLVGVFRYCERNLKGSVATNLSDTSPA
jgi:predicted nucleotidyltransferase